VSPTGAIAANAPSWQRSMALRAVQTFEDKKRGTMDAMAYSASVGVTTNVDMEPLSYPACPTSGFIRLQWPREPGSVPHVRRFAELTARENSRHGCAFSFSTMDTQPNVPLLNQRLLNMFRDYGDDMMGLSGIGEFARTGRSAALQPTQATYTAALSLIAKQGWAFQQHTLSRRKMN